MRPEQRQDHVAEQGAFGVDLRRHDHSPVARPRRRADQKEGQNECGDGGKGWHESYTSSRDLEDYKAPAKSIGSNLSQAQSSSLGDFERLHVADGERTAQAL